MTAKSLPKITFFSSRDNRDNSLVNIEWNVEGSNEVMLLKNDAPSNGFKRLNWRDINESKDEVAPRDNISESIKGTAAYHLIARNSYGISGVERIIGALEEKEEKFEPIEHIIWDNVTSLEGSRPLSKSLNRLARMGKNILQIDTDNSVSYFISGNNSIFISGYFDNTPSINFSIEPNVIFEDEFCIMSWSISNANCVTISSSHESHHLAPDLTKASGTADDGYAWGNGGMPQCAGSLTGSYKIDKDIVPRGTRHEEIEISAENELGKSANIKRWYDLLSIPIFRNCTPFLEHRIREAIRSVDKNLRQGGIINNNDLDISIDAFKDGLLSRQNLWRTLLKQLENMDIITFNFEETNTDHGYYAYADYSNEIRMGSRRDYTWPNLEFFLMLLLVIKHGFNAEIKNKGVKDQSWEIASACLPIN